MPWLVEGNCVYKKNEDGSRGELVKCHDSPEQAKAQMRALYANVEESGEATQANLNELQEGIRTSYFGELVSLQEASLDSEKRKVRVTLLASGWSANNRYYPPEVLERDAHLFEGAKCYVNHPGKAEMRDRPERDVRDLVGFYEDVRVENGVIKGTLFVEDATIWPKVETAVNHKPDYIGLSINALGKTKMGHIAGKRGVIVESIVKANSGDIVTTPAAGGKFEQLLMSSDDFTKDLLEALEYQEWREARPDFFDRLFEEWKTPRDTKALEAARDEATALKESIEGLEAEKAELEEAGRTLSGRLEELREEVQKLQWTAQVDRLLNNSRIPQTWREAIRLDLIEAGDLEAAEKILEREVEKLKTVRPKVPVRGAPSLSTTPQPAVASPVLESLGVVTPLLPGESYPEYAARIESQRASKQGE